MWSEDTADWIDRTARVEKISALTLEQRVAEYLRLKKMNAEMMRQAGAAEKAVRQQCSCSAAEKPRGAAISVPIRF